MKQKIFLLVAIGIMLCACNQAKFVVDGNVAGATDTTTLILEYASNGNWFVIDTVRTSSSGDFKVSGEAPEFPNIYRLRYQTQSIYFPVDSIDHLTIKTKLKAFDTEYTIEGSEHAKQVMEIDKQALQFEGGRGTAEELEAWKHRLATQIVQDPAGIVAYYIVNKYVDGRPLFDPLNDKDLKIIGAVANAFNSFKPNDPRTNYLVNVLLAGQQRRIAAQAPKDTIQATETKILEIKLQDKDGKQQSLQQVTSQGKVVILNFTAYSEEFSPALNKLLNDIYVANHERGLEIYQVSFDENELEWRLAAKPLPWITVLDPQSVNSNIIGMYNLQGIPTSFIINRSGEIVERVSDVTALKAAVAKYM